MVAQIKLTHKEGVDSFIRMIYNFEKGYSEFAKINTPPWVFFTFFKLYKWYQILQRTTYACK